MDGHQFDNLVKKLATETSRRQMIKSLAVGAAAALGLGRAGQISADHQVTRPCQGGTERRTLGQACSANQCCVASEHLVCERVAATGAHRCECDLHAGFVACGGQCVSINCPDGGTLNTTTCQCEFSCPGTQEPCRGQCFTACPEGQNRNTETCACECPGGTVVCGGECRDACPEGFVFDNTCECVCPSGTELCQGTCHALCADGLERDTATCACDCPSGTELCGSSCVSTACPDGQSFNSSTCSCGCPQNEVFCGGRCVNPATICAGQHNKIFNIACCNAGANPCQNPGQPSGKCKK